MSIAAYCDGGDWRPKTEPRWTRRQRDALTSLQVIARAVRESEQPKAGQWGRVRDDTGYDPRDDDEDDLPEASGSGLVVVRSVDHVKGGPIPGRCGGVKPGQWRPQLER